MWIDIFQTAIERFNMIKSMFSGVAGLRTHQSKMDVIGNNIANVNTYGYKTMRTTFKESIYSTNRSSSDGNTTMGGRNASQIGYGSQVGSVDLLFTSGSYAPTDSPTDCMIDGQGLFLLGPKDLDGAKGNTGVPNGTDTDPAAGQLDKFFMSRVGDFKIDGDGYLVNSDGYHVYGFVNADTDENFEMNDTVKGTLKPIRIQASKGKDLGGIYDDSDDPRMNIGAINIDANGTVSGIDADTKKPVTIGKIAVANVPNANGLEKTQGPYYKAVANVGTVRAYEAGTGSTGNLLTNGLEMANVDLAREFSDMITTQRGFQANTRIITVSDQMLEEMMAMKR